MQVEDEGHKHKVQGFVWFRVIGGVILIVVWMSFMLSGAVYYSYLMNVEKLPITQIVCEVTNNPTLYQLGKTKYFYLTSGALAVKQDSEYLQLPNWITLSQDDKILQRNQISINVPTLQTKQKSRHLVIMEVPITSIEIPVEYISSSSIMNGGEETKLVQIRSSDDFQYITENEEYHKGITRLIRKKRKEYILKRIGIISIILLGGYMVVWGYLEIRKRLGINKKIG